MADLVDVDAAGGESVATRMRAEPVLKSSSAFWRAFWRLVAVDRLGRHAGSRELVGDPVGAVLGAREDDHALIAGSLRRWRAARA